MKRLVLVLLCGAALASAETRVPIKAVLASAVLPGTGELMLGARGRGEAMLWIDGAAWLVWGGLVGAGTLANQHARLFAGTYAGASTHQTETYYRALQVYSSSDRYNEDVRRLARTAFPSQPDSQEAYLQRNGFFGEDAWQWPSDTVRIEYWRARRGAQTLLSNAALALGAVIVNRLVSVVDCAFYTQGRGLGLGTPPDRLGLGVCYRF